jgi:hypothetical protein
MPSCPTCLTALPDAAASCARCGPFAAGSPVLLTVALTPEGGAGVSRHDSRFPPETVAPSLTPPPDRQLSAVGLTVPPPAPPPAVIVKLRVVRGLRIGAEFPVYTGRNVIGRFADRPVDIDLTAIEPDGQVWSSRRHACLTLDRTLLVIEDLNSLNGTWVNGARVRAGGALPLKAGDVIQIGVAQLRVDVEAAPPPA